MILRGWIVLTLVAASATSCGASGTQSDGSDPHPPRSEDERFVAARYGEFVRAVERKDAEGICRYLEPRLAESYRCDGRSHLRIPRAFRRINVPMADVAAVRDPSVPDEIQISSRSTRKDRLRLILFFRQRGSQEWRIRRAILGAYG